MAKRGDSGVNKSEEIRKALQANPGKGPKEIAEMLKAAGVAVNAQYVSVIKGTMKKRKGGRRGRKPGRKPGGVSVRASATRSGNALTSAIQFVKDAGGIKAAKEALAAIEEIKSLS
jgi:hypothetical protein